MNNTIFNIIAAAIGAIIPSAATVLYIYFFYYRLRRVYNFRLTIIDYASKAAEKSILNRSDEWDMPYRIFEKASYAQMLYSFKPFKLESWYNEQEIKIIKGQ